MNRSYPAVPMFNAISGFSIKIFMASASSFVLLGGTRIPVFPLSTILVNPPVFDAIIAFYSSLLQLRLFQMVQAI